MENLNHALFALLTASDHPGPMSLDAAIFFVEYAIWVLPIIISIAWLKGNEPVRKLLLEGTISGLSALLFAQIIGVVWPHPRPFMVGMGHTYLPHVADSSFPSDHLTLLWAVAFSFLLHQRTRMAGIALALLGVPMAWARIYLGVHFPFDMVGAALVAIFTAWLAALGAQWFIPPFYTVASYCHQRLFRRLIRRGWVRR